MKYPGMPRRAAPDISGCRGAQRPTFPDAATDYPERLRVSRRPAPRVLVAGGP
jgi:hypothetical protein